MRDIPIDLRPGVVITDSVFAEAGRWVDSDKVRFYRRRPQKIGGWTKYSASNYTGVARALHAWSDFSLNNLVMVGTHCKLMVYDSGGSLSNVTPFDATGTLGTNPFTTVNGSTEVTVSHTSHGRNVGATVIFAGATTVGGLDLNGTYIVQSVPDSDSYTIAASSAASASSSGGGASVTYQYEINCGLVDAAEGGGWGIGGWGQETWGTERQNATFVQLPRIWFISTYGEDVVTVPLGGDIYHYDSSTGNRATKISNSPSNNQGVFVTDDRHVIALGAGGNPLVVQWPDQTDFTVWTPAVGNTAGQRTLQEGSRIVAGSVLQNRVSLIWTDSAVYEWQYTGTSNVFDSRLAGTKCGLIGPNAFVVVDGIAYWMSRADFHMYSGYVREMPNVEDVREWVADRLSDLQGVKTFCGYNSQYNEIWWWFVEEGKTEPSIYVAYHLIDQVWIKGTMDRAAFTNQENAGKEPLLAGTAEDGFVYKHEVGVNDDAGAAIEAYITMAPFNIEQGARVVDVWHFEPNFETQAGNLSLELITYEHRSVNAELDDVVETISEEDVQVDAHVSGRYLGMTIRSNEVDGDFRLGQPTMSIDDAGDRRG